jgi:hypothetical protein
MGGITSVIQNRTLMDHWFRSCIEDEKILYVKYDLCLIALRIFERGIQYGQERCFLRVTK